MQKEASTTVVQEKREEEFVETRLLAPSPDQFFYRETNGQWMGPYSEVRFFQRRKKLQARMLAWYREGYFSSDLAVRRNHFNTVHKLGLPSRERRKEECRLFDSSLREQQPLPPLEMPLRGLSRRAQAGGHEEPRLSPSP